MKFLLPFLLVFLIAACDDDKKLPDGYKLISIDGNSYFVYMPEKYIGDKTSQREAGKIVCVDLYKSGDYCDVYFWTNMEDIPKKFPIVNRKTMIGLFQMRDNKLRLRPLTNSDKENLEVLR